jgi:polar amino acid transport system permease protein
MNAANFARAPHVTVRRVGSADAVVPRRHVGRWITAAVVLSLAAAFAHSLVTNPRFQWDVVGHYFLSTAILHGLLETLLLTAVGMLVGIAVGIMVALMRQSRNPILKLASWIYLWFFRGTPVLVQLIFWYNLAALYPRLSLGIPFGPAFVSGGANSLISPFTAAIIGLGLSEGAFMAEVVRAGVLSVPEGQIAAATALGMTHLKTMRRIVLPQAVRVIIPPTGNESIGMLKTTALVSVISISELLYSAQLIYARSFETIPLLIVVSFWYLIVTSALSVGQYYLEKHFGRSVGRASRGQR